MKPEWALRILKWAGNLSFKIINRFLPEPTPTHPQTRMLKHSYLNLMSVYQLQVKDGALEDSDGNFERFLTVTYKLLGQLAERERYYRAWLGLVYLLAEKELHTLKMTPQELKAEIKNQWLDNIDFLPDGLIRAYVRDFSEIVLTNNLSNLLDIET